MNLTIQQDERGVTALVTDVPADLNDSEVWESIRAHAATGNALALMAMAAPLLRFDVFYPRQPGKRLYEPRAA